MATFEASVSSSAVVDGPRDRIWQILTDPQQLVAMTPLLCAIDADGDTWVWRMQRLKALGVGLEPVFTEAMAFEDGRHISFRHAPPKGQHERIGAAGDYTLSDAEGGGTNLSITLSISADLPLPRASHSAVEAVMRRTMDMMGDRFSKNLVAAVAA